MRKILTHYFWKGLSFGAQLWTSIVLQGKGLSSKLGGCGFRGTVDQNFRLFSGRYKWMTPKYNKIRNACFWGWNNYTLIRCSIHIHQNNNILILDCMSSELSFQIPDQNKLLLLIHLLKKLINVLFLEFDRNEFHFQMI